MSMDPTDIRLAGAVPLDRLAAPAAAAPAAGAAVYDVTDATFTRDVVERSTTVPVVLDFWASWCGPCKQLSPILERLAAEAAGAWVLAKIDVDANPGLAQAFQVQGIPMVMAVIGGRPVELFTGVAPEEQVRQVMDQVVAYARQQGIEGAAPAEGEGGEPAAPAEPVPAYVTEAQEALDRGDTAAAAAAYDRALADNPGDDRARQGLAGVRFLERLQAIADPQQARQAAADRPDDVDAALQVADVDLYAGAVDDAFARLIDLVRRTSGDDRDRLRERLLSLFDVVGGDDPSVVRARRALTSALF